MNERDAQAKESAGRQEALERSDREASGWVGGACYKWPDSARPPVTPPESPVANREMDPLRTLRAAHASPSSWLSSGHWPEAV